MALDRIQNFFRDGILPILCRPTKLWWGPMARRTERMTGARVAVPLALAVSLALGGMTIGPRAFDAAALLASQDDPVALADRAVARRFDGATATREIAA